MAKTTNPLHSSQVSGSIAELLTFTTRNGKTVVKKYSRPKPEPSAAQARQRLALGFYSQAAKRFPSDVVNAYGLSAEAQRTTAAGLYLKEGISQFKANIAIRPTGVKLTSFVNSNQLAMTATAGRNWIELTTSGVGASTIYGIIITRESNPVAPSNWQNIIAYQSGYGKILIKDLAPATTYYFGMLRISISAFIQRRSSNVTVTTLT